MTSRPDACIEFLSAIGAAGLEIKGSIIADGKIHRCHVLGDGKGKKNGWYVWFLDGIAAGSFGSWKTGQTTAWCAKSDKQLTKSERLENKRRMDEARALREAEEVTLRASARDKAFKLWDRAGTVDAKHGYLVKKGIRPVGAEQIRNMLVLPLRDVNGVLHSLQFIMPNGDKRFLTGGRKKGCFTHLQGSKEDFSVAYVVEGWATGCSVHAAIDENVFVCFDAGNLLPVCQDIRKSFPDVKIVICADDDYQTDGNPGVTKALEVAEVVGGFVATPDFGDDRPDSATDFNDLHQHLGLAAVRECIDRAGCIDENCSKNDEPVDNVIPIDRKPKSKPKSKEKKPIDWGKFNRLVEEFVLIYGTDTCFDIGRRMVVKINHLRLAAGADYVKMWLASDKRRMILPDQLIFDPSGRCELPDINLFDGLPMVPVDGDCEPIMELLYHLCADSADNPDDVAAVVQWTLKWLALPLQRLGTKMRSALVFHGPQGAGKNLFFEIIAKIYGRYAVVVGQEQIEDKFNDWASQKLFVIGDEVVARQELYHQKNKLKAFITGETIQINTKMMPLRTEANHVNVVFLSNEHQPLALEVGDRRYFVIYTPPARNDGLYKRVADCLDNGGIEAFYHYLKKLDLSGFSAFDHPPMTAAKRDLIDLGLRPAERFLREWVSGYLPLPLHACSAGQLFKVFKHWSALNGERFPPNQEQFTKTIKKSIQIISKARDKPDLLTYKVVKVIYSNNSQKSERCWIPHDDGPGAEQTEGAWMASQIANFNGKIDTFTDRNSGENR